jgi:hypothetical protein
MKHILPTTVFVLLVTLALPAAARKWTSKDGHFSTDAELVEITDDSVKLKKASGDIITVPLERLSDLDRRYLVSAKKKLPPPKKEGPSYSADIQPFLTKYCAACHNQTKAKEGYDVTTYAVLTREGKKGALVVPNKSAESRLVLTLQGKGKPMPPKQLPQPTPEEIAKVTAWIDSGAEDDTASPPTPNARGAKAKTTAAKK